MGEEQISFQDNGLQQQWALWGENMMEGMQKLQCFPEVTCTQSIRFCLEELAALPETYLTAWGVLHETIEIQRGQQVLIRGGSSSVGLAAANISRDMGVHVFATTRSETKSAKLRAAGVDEVILDSGPIADEIKNKSNGGVDGVVELVGLPETIMDCLQ